MSRYRMAAADAAWLHMDRRTNRSVVTSVMWCDEEIEPEAWKAVLQERLVERFPRFRQRVDDRTTSVWWEDVEDFRIEEHLHYATLPAPGGPAELQRFTSDLLAHPLDRTRPLWEMYLVTGYGDGGCAVVSRMHHCIADGMSLARLMMSLTDDPREASSAQLTDEPAPPIGVGTVLGRQARRAVQAGMQVAVQPAQTAKVAVAATRSLLRLLALPPDAHTSLRGHPGQQKTATWSEPIPIDELKDAARAHHATVNDLVLTAMAGALRSYLARTDGHVHDIRGVVPINLRPADKPLPVELGNAFGLLYLALPLTIDDPLERLAEVRRRTQALKNSAEPVVSYQLLGLTGRLPYEGEQAVVDLFSTKASLVITNVIGPRRPVHLAGRTVRGTIGWPPESGNLGLGLAIISYGGTVVIGALADDGLVRDPERLVTETRLELERLQAAVPAAT